MPKKDLRMIRDGVRNAVQPEKSRTQAEEIMGAVTPEDPNAKCTLPFAVLAEQVPWILFNHPGINQFIVAIAINQKDNSINSY